LSVAVGTSAALTSQGAGSVAVGVSAGQNTQGASSVALGSSAGQTTQGILSVAVGTSAGQTLQGNNSIAIGALAGTANLAPNCVVLGFSAGTSSVANANSIVINATGGVLNSAGTGTLTIAPIRGIATATPVLVYDTTTKEITYNASTRKIKTNIIDLTANTSRVYDIRPVEYDAIADGKHFVGLIAEEVYDIDPHFAWTQDGSPEGIEWFNILVYAVAEMKKLKIKNEELEARINILENN
jgi:hypothetical protein